MGGARPQFTPLKNADRSQHPGQTGDVKGATLQGEAPQGPWA